MPLISVPPAPLFVIEALPSLFSTVPEILSSDFSFVISVSPALFDTVPEISAPFAPLEAIFVSPLPKFLSSPASVSFPEVSALVTVILPSEPVFFSLFFTLPVFVTVKSPLLFVKVILPFSLAIVPLISVPPAPLFVSVVLPVVVETVPETVILLPLFVTLVLPFIF